MSTEVFNPNPTIFAPTKSKKTYARQHSLWLDDGEREDDEFDQSDEPETIDQDEIFGRSTRDADGYTNCSQVVQSSSGQYPTRSTAACPWNSLR